MLNAVTIQDKYIAKVMSYDIKNNGYYSALSNATRVARKGLTELGFSVMEAQNLISAAYEVAQHEKFLKEIGWTE